MNYRKIIYYLREYFFPAGCASCGGALLEAENTYYGICKECRSFLNFHIKFEESYKKEYSSKYFIRQIGLFPYFGRFKNVLREYKFGKSLAIGNYLSMCLENCLKDIITDDFPNISSGTAWVPVPPRPGKIKKEGWDQIAFLSGLLSKSSQSIPVKPCLKRLKSKSQKELNKGEREKNLKGRIICVREPPETAILLDDVITTGATLNACAQALLEKGTKKIYGVCLFFD